MHTTDPQGATNKRTRKAESARAKAVSDPPPPPANLGNLKHTDRIMDALCLLSLIKNVQCVRETEILVEQQPPQGVLVCDHAGLVINTFSTNRHRGTKRSIGF